MANFHAEQLIQTFTANEPFIYEQTQRTVKANDISKQRRFNPIESNHIGVAHHRASVN